MTSIAKNPPKYHELCKALDAIPMRGREQDPAIPGISSREKMALMALSSYCGADGQVFPSMAVLAMKVCLGSNEGIRKILAALRKKGYIWPEERSERDERTGKERQTSSNWYFSEAVFLLLRLQNQEKSLHELRWVSGGSEEAIARQREAIEETRARIHLSLENTRNKKPGASKRNGRLGHLTKQVRRYTKSVESLKEYLEQTPLSQEESDQINLELLEESKKLREFMDQKDELLATGSDNWAPLRPLQPGERVRRRLRLLTPCEEAPGESPEGGSEPSEKTESGPVLPMEDDSESVREKLPKRLHAVDSPRLTRIASDSGDSGTEQKPEDFSQLYQLWKEKQGPFLSLRNKEEFEQCSGMDKAEALAAAQKVFSSPFLLARFRSLLWLSHIGKEEFFEEKARRKAGETLYYEVYHRRKTPEEALEELSSEQTFETYKGPVTIFLKKDLLIPWLRPWFESAVKDSEARREQESRHVDTGPPLPDFAF